MIHLIRSGECGRSRGLRSPRFAGGVRSRWPIASERVRRALGVFGLAPEDAHGPVCGAPAMDEPARLLADALASRAGAIALICGSSGAGKSTLLRAVARVWRSRDRTVIDARDMLARADRTPMRPIADLFARPVEGPMGVLGLLAAAGLADGAIPGRTARQLSDGQRDRLAIALALDRALGRGIGVPPMRSANRGSDRAAHAATLIVLDELASRLDRLAAACLARTLLRLARTDKLRVLCATAHDDLAPHLCPTIAARVRPGGRVALIATPVPASPPPLGLTITRARPADYAALSHLHYRAGPPAVPVHALVARMSGCAEPVGVLVLAMPSLNGPWRERAWPGRYSTGDKRADAARLNAEVRTIARVIVDPRCRAVGIATALVRAYLADPLTVRTEALAAMGSVCGFFERAGMRAIAIPPSARDARLGDALTHARVRPIDLLGPAPPMSRFVRRELERWADGAGATRPLAHARAIVPLARAAGLALCSRPIAYTASTN